MRSLSDLIWGNAGPEVATAVSGNMELVNTGTIYLMSGVLRVNFSPVPARPAFTEPNGACLRSPWECFSSGRFSAASAGCTFAAPAARWAIRVTVTCPNTVASGRW